ncbi:MAG TPA: hypothetical protein EYP59_05660 [Thiotrichaceae bacterium]|nr:hypothetical protein [Thiotrichaceae bacterium]
MKTEEINDILPEYDFSEKQGERGKYYQAYRQGHHVKIHKDEGTVETHYFTLEDGAVMLEPDVSAYFPDSEVTNRALRGLIALIPKANYSKA